MTTIGYAIIQHYADPYEDRVVATFDTFTYETLDHALVRARKTLARFKEDRGSFRLAQITAVAIEGPYDRPSPPAVISMLGQAARDTKWVAEALGVVTDEEKP